MALNSKIKKSCTTPETWITISIKFAVQKISLTNKKLRKKEYTKTGKLPVVDQGHNFIGGYSNNNKLKIECISPLIVFGDHTKVIKYVDFDFVAGADGVNVIRPLNMFLPKLFYYFLQTIQLPEKGYARHFQFLEKMLIPLPPLPEQHRIVAKIEELFTRLNAGIKALKKIKAQLKRYRQAVLKYAFEGKLTEKWREKHKYRLKTWSRTRLGNCCELITKGESPKWQGYTYVKDGITFIRSENVLWGEINLSNAAKIPIAFHEKLRRSQLKANDVLINLVGASIGRCGVLPSNVERANINQAVALIRINDELDSQFLMHLLLTPNIQKKIHDGKVETARPNISLTDLRHLEISLPNMEEQHQIVSEIERRFSVADKIEKIVDESLKQSQRLRQSILKRAFEGKLVPQDPNDPPASELLKKIKEIKEKNSKSKFINKGKQ